MYTVSGKLLSVRLFLATILTAMLLLSLAAASAQNTSYGTGALSSNTTGTGNTAIGENALNKNTQGTYNTALGYLSLSVNTTGNDNTALGDFALISNTTGYANTANGVSALYANTTGINNTATGYGALFANSTGTDNEANGYAALYNNTTGYYNTANGTSALYYNTLGNLNTANGTNALYYNTTGTNNTANGVGALYSNVVGNGNTADGYFTLFGSLGSYNTALGNGAGVNITTGSYNIDIGNEGASTDNGIIRIGVAGQQSQTFIAGINGVNASGGVPVYINANGQLGTITSSQRFKYDIHDMGQASDKLMDLRPVLFRYKEAAEDGTHPQQYGLIAEDVAKVYPDLVQYDKSGKPFTVYYHLLTPMMLNELQKAHKEINSLKADQHNQTAALQTQVTSLQHTVQQLLMVVGALVLVALVGAAYFLSVRLRRFPSWQVQPIEKCAS